MPYLFTYNAHACIMRTSLFKLEKWKKKNLYLVYNAHHVILMTGISKIKKTILKNPESHFFFRISITVFIHIYRVSKNNCLCFLTHNYSLKNVTKNRITYS